MTQDQFIQSEIYKLVRFDYPSLTQLEIVHKVNEISWDFNEDESKIHIEGGGYNIVFGWNDETGFFSLEDEDEEFDEKRQEGEL